MSRSFRRFGELLQVSWIIFLRRSRYRQKAGEHTMRNRFTLGVAFGALVVLGLVAQPAKAVIVNGSFEDFPDFTGWVTIGNASIQQADFHPTGDEVPPAGQ